MKNFDGRRFPTRRRRSRIFGSRDDWIRGVRLLAESLQRSLNRIENSPLHDVRRCRIIPRNENPAIVTGHGMSVLGESLPHREFATRRERLRAIGGDGEEKAGLSATFLKTTRP